MRQSLVVYAKDIEEADKLVLELVNAGYKVGVRIRPIAEDAAGK